MTITSIVKNYISYKYSQPNCQIFSYQENVQWVVSTLESTQRTCRCAPTSFGHAGHKCYNIFADNWTISFWFSLSQFCGGRSRNCLSCGKCDPDRHSCFIDGTPSLVLLLLHWVVQHLCQSLTLIEFGIRLLKNCKLRQDFFVAVYKLLLALFRMKIAVFSCNCFIRSNKGSRKKTLQELRMLSSVTLKCQVTKIVINSGSQLSGL